jgi:endonuclease G
MRPTKGSGSGRSGRRSAERSQSGVVRLEDMHWLGGKAPAERAGAVLERSAGLRIHAPDHFKGRKGYDPRFISGLPVPLPRNVGRPGDEAPVAGGGHVLRYTNFSTVMSKSRRIPLYTACNIDGKKTRKIKRAGGDTWFLDGRVALEHQVGEELYTDNILDRGHLVRREDPVWGPDAARANDDTFHFTNCAPQAGAMNQRTWLGLEDYVLGNTRVHLLRVCVFTGPVLRTSDRRYRDVLIPREFWKVVVVRTPERPSATAYLVSQAKELTDLEFAFGRYKTYQVAIREVEQLTGLDFGKLSRYDGFSNAGALESARPPRVEIDDWRKIRI